jgi:hypothetical protein
MPEGNDVIVMLELTKEINRGKKTYVIIHNLLKLVITLPFRMKIQIRELNLLKGVGGWIQV